MNTQQQILKIIKERYSNDYIARNIVENLPLNKQAWHFLENCTLVVFTYETVVLNSLQKCKNILDQLNPEYLFLKFIPTLPEQKLIELYKYHVPDRINCEQKNYLKKIAPSVGWPMVRYRFSKPMLVCLIKGEKDFCKRVLACKGSADPKLCTKNQVRYYSPNMSFTLMHSSDDIAAVLFEAIILLGFKNVVNILNNFEDENQLKNRQRINEALFDEYIRLNESCLPTLKNTLNYTKEKIHWLKKVNQNNVLNESQENVDLLKDLELILFGKCGVFDIDETINQITKLGVVIDEWQINLLRSHLFFKLNDVWNGDID